MRTLSKHTLHSIWWMMALAILTVCLSAESCQTGAATSVAGIGAITITNRTVAMTVQPGAMQSVNASCQAGEFLLSGGYSTTAPAYGGEINPGLPTNRYVVFEDFPSSATTWTVSVMNRSSGTEAGSIEIAAQALCASGLPTTPTIISSFVPLSNGGTPSDATCVEQTDQHGSSIPVLTGGGYRVTGVQSPNDVVTILASYPLIGFGQASGFGLSAWHVSTTIAKGSTINPMTAQIHVFAICGSLKSVAGAAVHVAAPAAPGITPDVITSGITSVSCDTGLIMAGAGFTLDDTVGDGQVITRLVPDISVTPSKWWLTLYSLPAASSKTNNLFQNPGSGATLMPVCLSPASYVKSQ